MPNRGDQFAPGGYYHVFNRGAGRGNIFVAQDNYWYFLRLLKIHAAKSSLDVICFCLMPNHYHLLLHQQNDTTISRFIQGLCSAYTQAFNRQQNRSGTLFEGRFKFRIVDREEHLLHLIRYIHRNPVAARMVRCPEAWQYSDYAEWTVDDHSKLPTENLDVPDSIRSWNHQRVHRFRNELGIPDSGEYKRFVLDYEPEKDRKLELQKYFLD